MDERFQEPRTDQRPSTGAGREHPSATGDYVNPGVAVLAVVETITARTEDAVPYERVVQRCRLEHGMGRETTEACVESLVAEGRLEKPSADTLRRTPDLDDD